QPRLRFVLMAFCVIFFSFVTTSVFGQAINTDKPDYAPGSIVSITGSGFQAGETVTLQVLHEGETGDNETSGAHAPWLVAADGSGNIIASWQVPFDEDEVGATLKLIADGKTSSIHAETTFTDADATGDYRSVA